MLYLYTYTRMAKSSKVRQYQKLVRMHSKGTLKHCYRKTSLYTQPFHSAQISQHGHPGVGSLGPRHIQTVFKHHTIVFSEQLYIRFIRLPAVNQGSISLHPHQHLIFRRVDFSLSFPERVFQAVGASPPWTNPTKIGRHSTF